MHFAAEWRVIAKQPNLRGIAGMLRGQLVPSISRSQNGLPTFDMTFPDAPAIIARLSDAGCTPVVEMAVNRLCAVRVEGSPASHVMFVALRRKLGELPATFSYSSPMETQNGAVFVFRLPIDAPGFTTGGTLVNFASSGFVRYSFADIATLPDAWLTFAQSANIDMAMNAVTEESRRELHEQTMRQEPLPSHAVRTKVGLHLSHRGELRSLPANSIITDPTLIELLPASAIQPASEAFAGMPLQAGSLRFEEPFFGPIGNESYIDAEKGKVLDGVDPAFAAKLARMGARITYASPVAAETSTRKKREAVA